MALSFIWILRGPHRVINWPNLNPSVVSGNKDAQGEGERDGGTASRWSSQNTHIY